MFSSGMFPPGASFHPLPAPMLNMFVLRFKFPFHVFRVCFGSKPLSFSQQCGAPNEAPWNHFGHCHIITVTANDDSLEQI